MNKIVIEIQEIEYDIVYSTMKEIADCGNEELKWFLISDDYFESFNKEEKMWKEILTM